MGRALAPPAAWPHLNPDAQFTLMSVTSLSHCAELAQQFDNDRFVCALFAPAPAREALNVLYAFNIELSRIREVVREPMLGRIRLQWWIDALDAVYAGQSSAAHPVADALAAVISGHALPRRHFDAMIGARIQDFEDAAPADLDALLGYADATSGALMALALEVLGGASETSATIGRHVAIAWALIGLVRSVPFHARARRLYLPADLNRSAGLNALALYERGTTAGLGTVVRTVSEVAQEHLHAAREARGSVSKRALPAVLVATLADGYLRRLRAAGYDPFDARVQQRGTGMLLSVAANHIRGRY